LEVYLVNHKNNLFAKYIIMEIITVAIEELTIGKKYKFTNTFNNRIYTGNFSAFIDNGFLQFSNCIDEETKIEELFFTIDSKFIDEINTINLIQLPKDLNEYLSYTKWGKS
jgi:hypothetical protein